MTRRRLSALLRWVQRTSKQRWVFLELYAGCAVLSRKVSQHGLGVLAFDVAAGAEFDLTAPLVQRIILGWMRAGIVAGLWLAFPCGTYSIARHPALRSKEHLRGLPHWKADPKASHLI